MELKGRTLILVLLNIKISVTCQVEREGENRANNHSQFLHELNTSF